MKPEVLIVHCIDTEGPLYESYQETFKRLETICNVKVEPTIQNLHAIQNKQLDLGGHEEAAANLVSPHRITTYSNWEQISNQIDCITKSQTRARFPDLYGNPWTYNWFILDHVGFTGENPRQRDTRHHAVFDFYTRHQNIANSNDSIGWHYHPLPINGNLHCSGNTFLNSANISEILCRKLIDRQWFPSTFRPGFHTERPDLSWFLDQWIPYDYGNQSMIGVETLHTDLSGFRFGDWSRAPKSWIPYHPDHYDYQVPGKCRRWIARCLNMNARLRQLLQADVDQAFEEAQSEGLSVLAFTNHDFRDMLPDIESVYSLILNSAQKYPDVRFRHENALNAFRKISRCEPMSPQMKVSIVDLDGSSTKLIVDVENPIFGPQPFLAIKSRSKYYWKNFDFESPRRWSFVFDWQDIHFSECSDIAIAAPSASGVVDIANICASGAQIASKSLNLRD